MEEHTSDKFISIKALELAELVRVKFLAKQIKNNTELRRILRQSKAELREQVYDLLKPYLAFTPQPFSSINGKGRV